MSTNEHVAGPTPPFAMKNGVFGQAILGGPNLCYRYALSRIWNTADLLKEKRVMWVMMNPSTATADLDDPTIAKCIRFSKKWGYNSIDICNTFAYRATDSFVLTQVEDPVGPENDRYLISIAKQCDCIIFAYGTPKHRSLLGRGVYTSRLLANIIGVDTYALRLSKAGIPYHPLYLPEDLIPTEWKPT